MNIDHSLGDIFAWIREGNLYQQIADELQEDVLRQLEWEPGLAVTEATVREWVESGGMDTCLVHSLKDIYEHRDGCPRCGHCRRKHA